MSLTACWSEENVLLNHETGFHKSCNIAHILLVIGKDVIRLAFTKCALSLTCCWHRKRWDEIACNKMCNPTNNLLVMGKDVMRQDMQCHSQPVHHRKRFDETPFHKMCNVTDFLLVVKRDLMRLPLANLPYHSLPVASHGKCDETAFHKICMQCYSQTVGHRERCDETFTKCAMSLTPYWS